jgi:hypothetical protein
MARLSRRERAKRRREFTYGTLILILIAMIASFLLYQFTHRSEGFDPETLCPVTGPKGHYVLLVDKTDPMTFTQKTALETLLKELVERKIPEGYLISVFVMGEDYKEASKPLVEICNPGKGNGKSELTTNLKQLKRQYNKKFITPLMQQMQAMVSNQSAKYSPIFEMLQMVSLQSFQRFPMDGERHLLIVSDLLHNTPELSLYKKLPSVEDFESSDYARRTFIELKDVKVDLYLLFNSPQFQTDSWMDFWEAYFEKTGATITSVTPMPG